MEENEVIESVNNLEVADQEETVENTVEEVETSEEVTEMEANTEEIAEETAEETEETEETEEGEQEGEQKQNKEDNKFARLARIQAEKEAEKKIEQARKEALEQGIELGKIQSFIGKENPYTGEKINDEYDAQEYIEMFEIDLQGKDPVKGYRELQKEKARTEAKKQLKLDEETKKKIWYEDDTKDFVNRYSVEKLNELSKDTDFNLFAVGKVGQVPLAQIYEDYTKLISKYERKSVDTAKKLVANNIATPGKADDGEVQQLNWENMPKEQFEKYLEKAKNGELR